MVDWLTIIVFGFALAVTGGMIFLAARSSRRYARYAYSNTRVRAMRADLLEPGDFEIALKTAGPGDLAEFIRDKKYKEVEELAVSNKGADLIELALNKNLSRTVMKVKSMSPAGLEIMLGKWDVWNLKLILRRIIRPSTMGKDELERMLLPAGELNAERLSSMVNCRSLQELDGALSGTNYAGHLKGISEDAKDIGTVEDALDRRYFENAISRLDPKDGDHQTIMELLSMEIDIRNILLYFRSRKAQTRPKFMSGGRIPVQKLESAKEYTSLLTSLEGTAYSGAAKAGVAEFEKTRSLLTLQRRLEQLYERKAISMSHSHPLSIGPIIGYLASKENEVKNLRIMARGKAAGLDESSIKEMLVMAGGASS